MFQLPTINELAERSRLAFRRSLKGSDAWVWPNNVYASAKVIAGVVFEVIGFAGYIQRQIFAHTAPDIESLRLHGQEFGLSQKPAAPATGSVVFTASSALTVSTNTVLRRADGADYLVIAGGAIATPGTLTVPVTAVRDGKAGNAAAGTPLDIVSGVTGASLAAVGADGVVLGADIEDIESFRARILFRKRNPPHGGAAADYVMWAGEVAGVSFVGERPTVFVERLFNGPGTVRVFPLMFDLYADGVPRPADVARVTEHIEMLRPAGTKVTVAAPVAVAVNVVVSGLQPNTSDVQDAVRAELKDLFIRRARVAGSDAAFGAMPYLASPTSFSRSWIWQAVANAAGEDRHVIVAPAGDLALASGEMAVLGDVIFI